MEIDKLDTLPRLDKHSVPFKRETAFASLMHRLFDILIICITFSQIKTIYKLVLATRCKNLQSTTMTALSDMCI